MEMAMKIDQPEESPEPNKSYSKNSKKLLRRSTIWLTNKTNSKKSLKSWKNFEKSRRSYR